MDKDKEKSTIINNWYADRYAAITTQRNILFGIAIITSISVLAALILTKTLYEQKSIDPYLIEVEKNTNIMTIVEQTSKTTYTAQESVREYFLIKYITARESYTMDNNRAESELEMIRLFSSPNVYESYKTYANSLENEVMTVSQNANATITIGSISYLTPNRAEIRISRTISTPTNEKAMEQQLLLIVSFDFFDLSLSLDEMHINPLGFQVTSYVVNTVKQFDTK